MPPPHPAVMPSEESSSIHGAKGSLAGTSGSDERIRATYGENYDRLAAVKATWSVFVPVSYSACPASEASNFTGAFAALNGSVT